MKPSRLYLAYLVFSVLPLTRMFGLKVRLLRWAGASIGSNVRIASTARFHLSGSLAIGDGTWIGEDVRIYGGGASVTIGANVDIGPRVTIVTGTHVLWGAPGRAAGDSYSRPIVLGDGSWLGACSTVIAGVTVGAGSMVAAGAVVTNSTDADSLVAGVPARMIRKRHLGVPSS